jgi:predicted nucleotidyltransferase
MTIVAQYIFGSHARGDYTKESDIDLLAVTDDDIFSSFSHGELNVSFYPRTNLLEDARKGSLFVMHIVREAVPTYDPENIHADVVRNFRWRSDFSDEIAKASDLGWFLLHQQTRFRNRQVVNRRISWSVRTILIALTAESGAPLFSPHELAHFADKSYVDRLLSLKSRDTITMDDLADLRAFLTEFGRKTPAVVLVEDLKGTWIHFRDTKNSIGIKTIAQMEINVEDEFYS